MLSKLFSTHLTDLLFEESDDFIGVYDINDERFIRINQVGSQMLGFQTEQEFLNNASWSKSLLLCGQTKEQQQQVIQDVLQQGRFEQEIELALLNGSQLWCKLVILPIHDGSTPYLLIRLRSLVRLHQAERELEQSVLRYEAVFTNATIGIIVADQRGRVVSINRFAKDLFGYPNDELLGQSIDVLVPTSVSHYHERLRESFMKDPQVRAMGHNRDLHARRKDGSVFPVEVSLSYFRLDDQLYTVAYTIDITFKKEAERELLAHRDRIERLNADLEQKVADRTHALMNTLEQLERSKDELAIALTAERELGELKSRFVSMASHEFRTPLTTILTSATLIEKYPNTDQQDKRQKHLQRIHASVNHLNDILEEFLSVGRLEEGKITANPVAVALSALLQDVVGDMQGMLKAEQTIQVNLNCSEKIWVDPSLLRKVIVNLLSNAIKYSGAHSIVTIAGECTDRLVTLSVSDQGVGISPEDQQHLFERFFRAKNVSNTPGTGLGLHIVARYIDLMGGTVSLQSELNKGTTVTLTLPLAIPPSI